MPKGKSSKGKRQASRKGRRTPQWENSTITRYTGPVIPAAEFNANQVIVIRLSATNVVSTGLTGTLFAGTSNDPSGFLDWSAYAALYQQYRVLAWKLTWAPRDVGFSASANVQGNVVVWRARTTSAISIPSSYNSAYDNAGAQVFNLGRQFSVAMRMNGTPDADWKSTTATSSTSAIAMYGDSFTANTVYGQTFYEILVQFRSRV